jgi:hypothetical protein
MKYGNRKTVVDGIEFDSAKEARRYCELKLLQRAGQIEQLELQKEFELIPAQYETYARYGKTGKRLQDGKRCIEKSCVYRADFAYKKNGQLVVEDTKSKATKTKDYIIKRKLMLERHGVRVVEV